MWTIRGAPHVYRRADLPGVAAATAPFSDADAGKRIFDAAKPLKAAGIPNLAALDAVADAMRSIVTAPMVKGEMSTRLTAVLAEPYLRFCRPCDAIHIYEQPFRLAALRAGLELEPGTSPPVLRPVPGLEPADEVPDRLDVVRAYLRLLGPATPQHVAGYLDAPVKDVKAHWPADAVEVAVDGEPRWLLADDVDRLDEAPAGSPACSARSTCTCRRATARCWSPTRPGQGPLADARPPGRGARRRRGRRHLAGAEDRLPRSPSPSSSGRRRRPRGRRSPSRPSGSRPSAGSTLAGVDVERLTAPARVDLRCAADSLDG